MLQYQTENMLTSNNTVELKHNFKENLVHIKYTGVKTGLKKTNENILLYSKKKREINFVFC